MSRASKNLVYNFKSGLKAVGEVAQSIRQRYNQAYEKGMFGTPQRAKATEDLRNKLKYGWRP